jgi:hypothetical protein
MRRPQLSISQILVWADFYHERIGRWPQRHSRFVYNTVGEKWYNIDMALRRGDRGLPGKSSLAQLLAERRGYRNFKRLPPFRERTILSWADAYFARHQKWPAVKSGPIPEAPGETWTSVDSALWKGLRGLPGKSSLAQLLAKRRGVRHIKYLLPFSIKAILAWADAYYRRHKRWPTHRSGPIAQAPGETWGAVHSALQRGGRGLTKGSSLPQLLERYRGIRNIHHLPRLTYRRILRWADSYHRRTGKWPTRNSGALRRRHRDTGVAPSESWGSINSALHNGGRGLLGGSSVARLLEKYRAVPNKSNLPRLTYGQVLRWADAHHRRTGQWPRSQTGPIPESPSENWRAVIAAFHRGRRGLPGDCSFAQLLSNRRGVRNIKRLSKLSANQILAWADRFYRLRGHWPNARSGPIQGGKGDTWMNIESALRHGLRGLPKGSSLFRLLKKHGRISESAG